MSITLTTDYTAEYKLQKDCFTELQTYIDKYEKYYLLRLLGAELYGLFDADLTASSPQVPVTTRFLDIFDAFEIDDGSCLFNSEGIRKMLIQFVYFHFVRDTSVKKTVAGVKKIKGSISSPSSFSGYNDIEAYNEAISNYQTIQWFIQDNDDDYPEENIQHLGFASGI